MKFRYELHKQLPDGQWECIWKYDTVEALNTDLTELLSTSPKGAYRGVCYDGEMKVGWREFNYEKAADVD